MVTWLSEVLVERRLRLRGALAELDVDTWLTNLSLDDGVFNRVQTRKASPPIAKLEGVLFAIDYWILADQLK